MNPHQVVSKITAEVFKNEDFHCVFGKLVTMSQALAVL